MPSKKKKLCFVLMPFKDDMKEVYWKAIKPAAEDVGFDCLRVDERKGPLNIPKEIVQHIFTSDAIVADLTGKNPNVFYEMGIAHAIANKTVMIIQKTEDLPFDVNNYRCIHYEQTENGLDELKTKLSEFLQCIDEWNNIPTNPVQDFKPHDAFILLSVQKELENQLQEKSKLLSNSVPVTQIKALQNELDRIKKELDKRPKQAEFLNLKKESDLLRAGLKEKEETEKKLRDELHQIKVTRDEADKKKPAETKIIPPPGMVLIPAGEFIMGTSEEQIEKLLKEHPDWKRDWFEWEKPAHKVWLDTFFMDQYLVTNAQYAEFLNDWDKEKDEQGQVMIEEHKWGVRKVKETWEPQKGFESHPVVWVTWYGAQQYARWAKKQLPTEAQWEKAARGGKGLKYGTKDDILSPKLANYKDSKLGKTTPVGYYPPNPYDLYDVAGNVWEWCQDWFDEIYYQRSPEKNPSGPKTGKYRVVRGGSWDFYIATGFRTGYRPFDHDQILGFRMVQSAKL